MKNQNLIGRIIQAAFTVHKQLGTGFLEKVYENAMVLELQQMGLVVLQQYPIEVFYAKQSIGYFSADLLIENSIIVEVKADPQIKPQHEICLGNYLAGTGLDIGLLINFGEQVEVKRKYSLVQTLGFTK